MCACVCMCHSKVTRCFHSRLCTQLPLEGEDAAVSAGGIYFSRTHTLPLFLPLLSHSPPLSCPPVCSSGDRSWQLFVCVSVSVCVCVCRQMCLAVWPTLNVTDHMMSLPPDYLETPPPPNSLHQLCLPLLFWSPSAPFISSPNPTCTPMTPLHPQHNTNTHAHKHIMCCCCRLLHKKKSCSN